MRFLRLGLTLVAAFIALGALSVAVQAAGMHLSAGKLETARSRFEQGTGFTRVQTITLVPAQLATATNLTTIWESYWDNLPFGFFEIPLPADFTTLTVGGEYLLSLNTAPFVSLGEVFTNKIKITPTVDLKAYLSYYTNSRAVREGNQFSIFVRANSPQTSTFKSTVAFTNTYSFVSYADTSSPTLQGPPQMASGQVWWGPLTILKGNTFSKSVVLADTRLLVDLAVKSYGVKVSADKNSVQVTATIVNSGSVKTGSYFFVEFYDRPSTAGAPSGPNDHKWGTCFDTRQCGSFRPGTWNYIAELQPSQTVPITFNYTFHATGNRKLYLQVDTFGNEVGLNLEPGGESNNIRFLGTYAAVGKLLLPIIRKSP